MNKYFKLQDIDKQEKPKKKGYKAKLIQDTINGIGFYILEKTQNTIEKENAQQELKDTSEKLIECFEYFLFKIANAKKINNLNDLIDILRTDDFPYNLEEILQNRNDLKNKITLLETEVENEND